MNNVVPPAPMEDPDGWTVLPEVEMHGTAFKQRKVTVRCTVSDLGYCLSLYFLMAYFRQLALANPVRLFKIVKCTLMLKRPLSPHLLARIHPRLRCLSLPRPPECRRTNP